MRTVLHNVMRTTLLVAIAVGVSGCSYNKFTTQEEAIKAQWAQVQNQIQRRNDPIPNLVETVKGYATHEESVFKEIADSRRGCSRQRRRKKPSRRPTSSRARSDVSSRLPRTIRT